MHLNMPLHLNKPALRVLAVAESFLRTLPSSVLAGVVMRSDLRVDGLAFSRASVGGDDATSAVLRIREQLDREDVNAILLSGAVIAWFNIIDIQEVFHKTGKPLVCLTYEESPGLERYIHEHFPRPEEKLAAYRRLGRREPVRLKTGFEVYVRTLGAAPDEARVLLNKFTLDGRVPEPVRVARLAARAALRADETTSTARPK